jgi:DNA polymerase III subunit epsilon
MSWLRGDRLAVVDFETTGMGPNSGARATEVGVVLLEGGEVVDQFASLMFTGVFVPPFIERLTGISNAMLDTAPGAREVMAQVHERTQGCPMVAHNAGFDRGFWVAELLRAGVDASQTPFICTVKLARRLYPQAPSHKLGSLAAWAELPDNGRAHRALADALTTAHLLQRMASDLGEQLREALGGAPLSATLLERLQNLPAKRWPTAARAAAKDLQQLLPV